MRKSQSPIFKMAEQTGERIIKTTIRIPYSLWARARIRALSDGVPVGDVVAHAIRDYIKKGGKR